MRRLEDKIRDLCVRVVSSGGDEQGLQPLMSELRVALRQHNARIRARLANYPLAEERRKDPVLPEVLPAE